MVIEERHIQHARKPRTCDYHREHVIRVGDSYWAQYATLDGHTKPVWWALCEACKAEIDALY